MKARYSFYLSPEATRQLRQAGMQNGASRSGIADEAIKAFLSPKPEMSQEPVIVRRLNSHSKALGNLQRDLAHRYRNARVVRALFPDRDAARA